MFWLTEIATFFILILAANTAYADFPRLSSIIARDGFLPRQFANRGDRLVYSNGVIFLAVVASILIVVFDGDISKLIPLYAFGVFTGFTFSQFGMVKHHLHLKEPNWKVGMAINATGALATGIIALIVVYIEVLAGSVDSGGAHPTDGADVQVDWQPLQAHAQRRAHHARLPGAA